MSKHIIQVQKWTRAEPPTETELQQRLQAEGLVPQRWENGPNEVYAAHEHDYHKVIYVTSGSITFGFPVIAEPTTLAAGDRLDLPPGVLHNAVVGPEGVVCLEAHKAAA